MIASEHTMRYRVILTITTALLVGPAASQEHVALSVEGWTAHAKADDVTAYRCASSVCAAGSEVSYKRQPHRPGLTLAEFEAHHRRLADHNRGTGRIRDLRISAPQERVIDGVRVLQVRRDFEWVDGRSHALIESRLIGPSSSYSVVSVSPKPEWTINNFEGFLPRLVDIAALEGVD